MKDIKYILWTFSFLFCCSFTLQANEQEVEVSNDTLATQITPEFSLNQEGVIDKATADSAYIRGEYATAIQIYEALLEEGVSLVVYYNLGNSYYKSEEIAKAILNYERALLLDPGNGDIRANLEIARAKTVDKEEIVPELFFITWGKSMLNLLSVDGWAKLGATSFILMLGMVALFLFGRSSLLKKISFGLGLFLLLLVVVTNSFASIQKKKLIKRDTAIVMTPSVTIRSTPSESGTSLFILHEGKKVTIKDNTMSEWKEIVLEDGKVGWIATKEIEII